MADNKPLVDPKLIDRHIFFIRGTTVLLSSHLAELYQVEPRSLVQAVKRNQERFPGDFMFQLTPAEFRRLESPGRSDSRGGSRRALPHAFTEQGVAMLSSVLKSPRAIQVNIEIMRSFVRLRHMLVSNADLARRLDDLERKYDARFKVVFDAIRRMMAPGSTTQRRIGFRQDDV